MAGATPKGVADKTKQDNIVAMDRASKSQSLLCKGQERGLCERGKGDIKTNWAMLRASMSPITEHKPVYRTSR